MGSVQPTQTLGGGRRPVLLDDIGVSVKVIRIEDKYGDILEMVIEFEIPSKFLRNWMEIAPVIHSLLHTIYIFLFDMFWY